MILVTGATGHVGQELVSELLERGERVRAMTRRPEAARFPAGVEVVRGDFDDGSTLAIALRGVERVFLMSAQVIGTAPAPTHMLALAHACKRAGVERVVELSVLGGGGSDVRDPIARWIQQGEAAVRESGAEWTLLRPGRFMSNALGWAAMLRRGDEISVPFATRPAASIDPADVARIAALALTGNGHAGKVYELSGPESLSPSEEVAILARVLGRPLRVNALPLQAAREGMRRMGMPEPVLEAVFAQTESDRGTHVLSTVQDVTGRPARTFAEWAEAHRADFS
jgi:uncharacterized protein YbjT (DUF2867 family)